MVKPTLGQNDFAWKVEIVDKEGEIYSKWFPVGKEELQTFRLEITILNLC